MASPAIASLANRREEFRLTLVTMFGSVTEYLREQGFTDDIRFVNFLKGGKGYILGELLKLKREHFDVSIFPYPHNRIEYNMVNRFVGGRQRIAFRYQRQRLVNLPILNTVILDEDPKLHVVEENLRWAAHLTGANIKDISDDMLFRHSADAIQAADEFVIEHDLGEATPLIGIHPSCNTLKNQQNRCWPPQQFVQFIERVARHVPTARFLLFEGPEDEHLAERIKEHAHSVSVARMLPVRVVGALIRNCDLFVSNVSGLIHIAAACKVPTVGIYGPTNPAWDGPWKTESIVVSSRLPCSPCFYYSSRPLDCPAKLDYACVRELPVDDVEKAALQLLRPVRV